jgi:hypothetical protein
VAPLPVGAGAVLSRSVLIAAVTVFTVIVIGCMSLQIGGNGEVLTTADTPLPPNACSDGMLEQHGGVTVPDGREQEVYYPHPYISPPNLTLHGDCEHCSIIWQKRDRFCIKNTGLFSRDVQWQAVGLKLRVGPPPVIVAPPPPEGPPAPVPPPPGVRQLPPEPVPVEPKP